MQYRVCTKCGMELPLTFEFFGVQQTNHKRFLTECRECKKIYQLRYQEKKRLDKDVESKRMKQLYVFPNLTKEQKQKRMKESTIQKNKSSSPLEDFLEEKKFSPIEKSQILSEWSNDPSPKNDGWNTNIGWDELAKQKNEWGPQVDFREIYKT